MKKLICILTVILYTVSFSFYLTEGVQERNSGRYSAVNGIVTNEAKAFIISNFKDADTPEELAEQILSFALDNFVYDKSSIVYPQTPDIDRFIYKNNYHGVCFDFAVFTKNVFCVIAQEKGWDNTRCYVLSGFPKLSEYSRYEAHSWNYISVENADGTVFVYHFDLTYDLRAHNEGREVYGISTAAVSTTEDQIQMTAESLARQVYPAYKYLYFT